MLKTINEINNLEVILVGKEELVNAQYQKKLLEKLVRISLKLLMQQK